jgi:hypothetical protein
VLKQPGARKARPCELHACSGRCGFASGVRDASPRSSRRAGEAVLRKASGESSGASA